MQAEIDYLIEIHRRITNNPFEGTIIVDPKIFLQKKLK